MMLERMKWLLFEYCADSLKMKMDAIPLTLQPIIIVPCIPDAVVLPVLAVEYQECIRFCIFDF